MAVAAVAAESRTMSSPLRGLQFWMNKTCSCERQERKSRERIDSGHWYLGEHRVRAESSPLVSGEGGRISRDNATGFARCARRVFTIISHHANDEISYLPNVAVERVHSRR